MHLNLDRLVKLDLQALSASLAAGIPAVSELGAGQWRSLVELLTMRLTTDCRELQAGSWDDYSAALGYALDAAMSSGDLSRTEAVLRRLNLSAALLHRVPPDQNVDLLNPQRVVELFLREAPMSAEQAKELSVGWRSLGIEDIRRLRAAKNLLSPTLEAVRAVPETEFDARLKLWEAVLPQLP